MDYKKRSVDEIESETTENVMGSGDKDAQEKSIPEKSTITKTRKRKSKKARPTWYYFVWLLAAMCLGLLIGLWVGRHLVYKSFDSLNTVHTEPELVNELVISMDTLNILYEQGDEYVPNTGYSTVFFGAQLFSSEDYFVYIHDSEGNEYHTTLSQCKLSVGDEDPNSVTIKEFKGVDHPYIIFHMDAEEFSTNVSPLFMEGFSDGMVNFVYQFLAETLPLAE